MGPLGKRAARLLPRPIRQRFGAHYAEYLWLRRNYHAVVRDLGELAIGRWRAGFPILAWALAVKHHALLSRVALPLRLKPTGRIWVNDWNELGVLHEVFVRPRPYDVEALPPEASTIVDLGVNIGGASLFFRSRYPSARIVGYEANPDVYRIALRNLGGDIDLHNAAVARTRGTASFRKVLGGSPRGSFHRPSGMPGSSITVPTVTLDSIIEEVGHVSILKIDIEGAEYEVLAGCRLLDEVDLILGEFHPVNGVTAERFFGLLEDFDLLENTCVGGRQGTFVARRRRAETSR